MASVVGSDKLLHDKEVDAFGCTDEHIQTKNVFESNLHFLRALVVSTVKDILMTSV